MIKDQKKSKRGGLRPNSGRKPGSRNKASWSDLLQEFEQQMNQGFVVTVVENYVNARNRQDWAQVCVYDRAILNKLAPDLHHIEVEVTDVEAKARAFAQALNSLRAQTKNK